MKVAKTAVPMEAKMADYLVSTKVAKRVVQTAHQLAVRSGWPRAQRKAEQKVPKMVA